MKLKAIQCPSCGAHIKIDVNSNSNICSFCGSQVVQDKKGFEISFKSKNETKIRKAEIQKELELERMRIKEKENKMSWMVLIGIIVGSLVIILISAIFENKDKNSKLKSGGIEIHQASKDYKNQDYKVIKSEFEALGFTNIKEEPIDDLITGILTKDGSIERISINGNSEFKSGDVFPADSPVIIAYHTFPEKKSSDKDSSKSKNQNDDISKAEEKTTNDQASTIDNDTEIDKTDPFSDYVDYSVDDEANRIITAYNLIYEDKITKEEVESEIDSYDYITHIYHGDVIFIIGYGDGSPYYRVCSNEYSVDPDGSEQFLECAKPFMIAAFHDKEYVINGVISKLKTDEFPCYNVEEFTLQQDGYDTDYSASYKVDSDDKEYIYTLRFAEKKW